MKTMDHVRGTMRGENRLHLKCAVADPQLHKSQQNLTKAVDRDAEDLILDALQRKFLKLPDVKAYTVFSEELGIKTFPKVPRKATPTWWSSLIRLMARSHRGPPGRLVVDRSV